MVSWSALNRGRIILNGNILNKKVIFNNTQIIRNGHHEVFPIRASDWHWRKFKDLVHYYLMVGVIPLSALVIYTNVFIGSAKLAPIPEGYVPKHWEYYSHPISRWMARYCFPNPQQDYEKYLHHLFAGDEKLKLRRWDEKIRLLIRDRMDYQAWFFRPIDANYTRIDQEISQELHDTDATM